MVTFLLSGLWHGANWTYVVWGGLNGLYLIGAVLTKDWQPLNRVPGVGGVLSVLSVFALISLSWIFFRAASMADAIYIVTRWFSNAGQWMSQLSDASYVDAYIYAHERRLFHMSFTSVIVLQLVEYVNSRRPLAREFAARPAVFRWAVYVLLTYITINSGSMTERPFIYFQF